MMKNQKKYLKWDTSIMYVKGVGPKLAALFETSQLKTVYDFVHRFPRTYQDNRRLSSFDSLVADQQVIVQADVVKKNMIPLRGKRHRKIYEIIISDGRQKISCRFFTMPYKSWFNTLRVGDKVEVRGKVTRYRHSWTFNHPQIFPASDEIIKEEDLILPVYSEIEQVTQYKIRSIMKEIFNSLDLTEDLEWLPPWLLKKYGLISKIEALKGLHFPQKERIDEYLSCQTAFQKRLIFDEFFEIQIYFAFKKQGWKLGQGVPISIQKNLLEEIKKQLPFELSSAQKKVLQEIFKDLQSPHPMHRLLQGDVGSGKTVVALISALICAKAGYQSVIMVPTEILADQHYRNASRFLEPFGVKVEKLTGKMKTAQKRTVRAVLQSGFCQVCIGTHALIQEDVQFHKLSFVVIDEQHRFGAHQRALLKSKACDPHFLVMTATPIPRTLSMAIYGDLDVSVIDELPKGRQAIFTRRVFPKQRKEVFDFLKQEVEKGRQAYVVYPLVEESENLDLKNANDQYEKLKSYYKTLRWGLLTGRMNSEEKQKVMEKFLKKELDVLVSTTVIEVGVDVPNASVMLIEHAERFGLSQMHQLRGRVGRGSHKSYCFVVLGDHFSKESSERACIMEESSDGFFIAEKDLEIRGPGEFVGSKQSGLPHFKLAHIIRDNKILVMAKKSAFDLVSQDQQLEHKESAGVKKRIQKLSLNIRPG